MLLLGAALWFAALAWARMGALRAQPLSQQAAERFSGRSGRPFVQLSAFFHPKDGVSVFDILLCGESLQAGLRSSGNGAKGTETVFAYGYSASAFLSVQSSRGTFRLPATGTGGDFFLFHPYPLLYGSLMELPAGNGIILDDRAAWLLFGAVDAVGQPVLIGGAAYVVSGVIRLEKGPAHRAALGDTDCMVFVPFDLLETGVTCYEVLLPEPVEGYGEALFAGLGVNDIRVNTARFSAPAIWKRIRSLPAYNMDTSSSALPYWENAARNLEMRIILWTLALVFVLLPVSAVLILILSVPPLKRSLGAVRGRSRSPGRRVTGPALAGGKEEMRI